MTSESEKVSPAKRMLTVLVGIAAVLVVLVMYRSWTMRAAAEQEQARRNTQAVYLKFAADEVNQYEIARRKGALTDLCLHAGRAAAGYLQAKNDAAYQQWKNIEKLECAAAGTPK